VAATHASVGNSKGLTEEQREFALSANRHRAGHLAADADADGGTATAEYAQLPRKVAFKWSPLVRCVCCLCCFCCLLPPPVSRVLLASPCLTPTPILCRGTRRPALPARCCPRLLRRSSCSTSPQARFPPLHPRPRPRPLRLLPCMPSCAASRGA
jgi:hypothetical protein